jgi:signal transduction histidine kinase
MYEYDGRMVRVTAVHDITDRKKAKAALQKAHDELEKRVQERTQQLADANVQLKKLDDLKNKFIGDMSHELRTPLANLNLYLDLLEMGIPEKRKTYLAVLRQATNRITRISEDVLAMIQLELFKENIQFKTIDLNKLITTIAKQQMKLAEGKGLDLIFVPNPHQPFVQADESKIRLCLVNLITNSINYTAHGQIKINVDVDEGEQRVCVKVADTGIGVEPEDLPYLFDRFYRGRQIGQSALPGSGLGLALVKEIVEIHGGSVEAENRPEKGSLFRCWLPLAETRDFH